MLSIHWPSRPTDAYIFNATDLRGQAVGVQESVCERVAPYCAAAAGELLGAAGPAMPGESPGLPAGQVPQAHGRGGK